MVVFESLKHRLFNESTLALSAYLFLIHSLNFLAAPALVAVLLVLFSRFFFKPQQPLVPGFAAQAAIVFIANTAALLLALLLTGRDGSMLGYAALVCAGAVCQWWLGGSWRSAG